MSDGSRQALRQAKAILETCVGRDNAITSQELSERLGGLDELDSTPVTRRLVRDVIAEYRLPIAGCPDGYFVVQSATTYEDAQARLDARIQGILERKELLATAWARSERPDPQHDLDAFDGGDDAE